jgi:hypothetical protein
MLQHDWWQIRARIRLEVNDSNCIEQVVAFFHQVSTLILVLFNGLE